MDRVRLAIDALFAAPTLERRRVVGIWLFGSYARAQATPDSDVDLAILCEPALGIDRAAAIDHCCAAAGFDIDVVDLASANAQLAWEIVTTGRLVAELDELGAECFVRNARYAAEDAWRRDRAVLLAETGNVGGHTR